VAGDRRIWRNTAGDSRTKSNRPWCAVSAIRRIPCFVSVTIMFSQMNLAVIITNARTYNPRIVATRPNFEISGLVSGDTNAASSPAM